MAIFRYGKMDKKLSGHLTKLVNALIKEKNLRTLSNLLVKTAIGLCLINKRTEFTYKTTGKNMLFKTWVVFAGRIRKRT